MHLRRGTTFGDDGGHQGKNGEEQLVGVQNLGGDLSVGVLSERNRLITVLEVLLDHFQEVIGWA
jgi:hypothetical protein